MKSIFMCEKEYLDSVYPEYIKEQLRQEAGLDETYIISDTSEYEKFKDYLRDVDYVFATWTFPGITEEQMKYFPSLKCVFYAAGSVKGCAGSIINCGRKIFSAWGANAVPVAEFTVSQIILANKGCFISARAMRKGDYEAAKQISDNYLGNYKSSVGIIGAGMIGTMVIEELVKKNFRVLVYDIFLSDEKIKAMGAEKAELSEIFSECDIVSNHIADNKDTRGMLDYGLFSKMKPNSNFINTGRGAQVVEEDLIRALKEKPFMTALLDVTWPEPPENGSELYGMENVFLTPHIAGSKAREHWRLSQYMLDEFRKYIKGEPCKYEVTQEVLSRMA